ncbi:MAG: T9SS type A sorting domain-containing protein, partial [Candidatus Eisenbacteria bacterium]|nr:T9SS type A sorting domain-containing protein [Candidatus Latescibacterota bacterium]MBD3302594.1 T9SS type A sorting domain-containing protein [Candidatus Eisenbacteria bacterium]
PEGVGSQIVSEPVRIVRATAGLSEAPAATALLGARPNPARDGSTVRFSLAVETEVDLAIYDVRGRRVRTLVSGVRPAGGHAVVWDGRDDGGRPVSSGIYLTVFRADGTRERERLVILR